MTSSWKSARTPFCSAPCNKGFITSARKVPCFLLYGVKKMNTQSCEDRSEGFILWVTRSIGTGSIRSAAGAFDSRSTRGNGSVVGLSRQPGTLTLTTGKSPGAGPGTILYWAGISNRRILPEPTSGKPRWTGIPCLIWMTTASRASPCCPPRPIWRWPWPARLKSSERNPWR